MFSYYLPDVFFLISGFLFASKICAYGGIEENKNIKLMATIGMRMVRLYPLYIAVFLIYWLITPGLHAGPVWYVYEDEVATCNSQWWSVVLMIDNWFPNGCYEGLWFVQVEFQYTLLIGSFFFIYFHDKKIAYIYLGVLILASWVLLFVLSGDMITTVDTAVNSYSQLYFRSFYSHSLFYLFGVMMALL